MSTLDPHEDALVQQSSQPDPPDREARRVRTNARVCVTYGCAVHLSLYNDTTTCWLHGPGADPMRQPR